jgi:chaperonin cofactor prefoldin
MKKAPKKRMSIEDLALSMGKGFKGVNKKIDSATDLIDKLATSTLKNFERIEAKMATKEDLKTQQEVTQIMLKEINAIHADTKSFRQNISTLYTDHLAYDRKIDNLTVRVEKLEIKK